MKDIEINSDKYTVLGIVFFLVLVLVLVVFFSNLYALASHHVRLVEFHFWDYPIAIFNVYVGAGVVSGRHRSDGEGFPSAGEPQGLQHRADEPGGVRIPPLRGCVATVHGHREPRRAHTLWAL